MRIVFRVDASQAIGAGHVMRCLALAQALAGNTLEFVCRRSDGDLAEMIAKAGHRLHRLAGNAAQDAAGTLAAIQSGAPGKPDWLIVDHYGIDAGWHAALRPHVGRILAIDDLADRDHDCDVLLDQNLAPGEEQRYDGRLPAGCRVLAGLRYALLREEFQRLRRKVMPRSALRQLLISFGGADAGNHTERALAALTRPELSGLAVDVVLGMSYPHAARIRERCAGIPAATLIEDPGRLAGCMAKADLAIGAAGNSLWERACLGLPSIVVAVAPNQSSLAARAAAEGIAIALEPDRFDAATLAASVSSIAAAPEKLQAMSRRAFDLVDGSGAGRVARVLGLREVRLRRAAAGDAGMVLEWRNAEPVRLASHDSRVIPPAEHAKWFQASLATQERDLLIAEIGGEAMGVLRYDVEADSATVSIYLAPAWIGRGYGTEVLRAGHAWLAARRPAVSEVRAEVLARNAGSRSAFLSAGYRRQDARSLIWSVKR